MKYTLKFLGVFILIGGLLVTSCVKDDFDKPEMPNPCDVKSGFKPNITIEQMGELFSNLEQVEGSSVRKFPDTNIVLEAVVVSSDEAGNLYKELYLQDATGAIAISVDGSGLFNDYPVGQTVHFKMSGLTIEFDSWVSIHEVGMGVYEKNGEIKGIGRIPVNHLTAILKNHSCPKEVEPKVIDLTSNNNSNLGKLVKIKDVQFVVSDTAKTYADITSNPPQNVSLTIEDCDGNTLVVRNSGYASFAGLNVPDGKGSIVGIYTKYGNTYQLKIRDINDVDFNDYRCNYMPPLEGGDFDNPITVAKAQEYIKTNLPDIWVKGYIRGVWVNDFSGTYLDLEAPFATKKNVCIADTEDETSLNNMIIIQLSVGEIRDLTNLKDNENLLGKSIKYRGTLSEYYGNSSLKNIDGYWLIDENTGINP